MRGASSGISRLSRDISLLKQLVKRDIASRYRGSMFGIFWSLLTPLIMLAVYGFVFTVVFKARWAGSGGGGSGVGADGEFAVILFSGLILHSFLSECLGKAPEVILNNVNLVKKVVFPLATLIPAVVGSAFFHLMISFCVLLFGMLFIYGEIPVTAIYFPLILLPFILVTLGLSWILAAVGVFFRDITQTMSIVITILLFLSPIFYPVSSLPESYQTYIYLNPLSFIVEEGRGALLWGKTPDWTGLLLYSGVGIMLTLLGYFLFQKMRRGFADVL